MSLRPIDNDPQVRPLGTDEVPPGGGRWVAATVGTVVAVGAVVLFLTSRPASQSSAESVPEVAATTDTTPEIDDRPLTLRVPGLTAGLVGVVADEGSIGAWTWPADIGIPLDLETDNDVWAQWDNSGAFLTELRDVGRTNSSLYFGPPDNIREVIRDVTEFVVHDTAAGDIAWVTAEAQPRLWKGRSSVISGLRSLFSSQIVSVDPSLGRLAAYGDWGFAFQTDSDRERSLITILDPEGELLTIAPGFLLDSTADGRLLMVTGPGADGQLVETDIFFAGVTELPIDGAGSVPIWSPDGSSFAVVRSVGNSQTALEIWEDGRLIRSLALAVRQATPMSWSADGRWIILGNIFVGGQPSRTIVVVDLADSSQHAIELSEFPVQVVVPDEASTEGTAEGRGEVTSTPDLDGI